MSRWHEKPAAKIGLRIAGLAMLGSAWMESGLLHRLVMANRAVDATLPQLLLAALLFVSISGGLALALVGAGLWKTVRVSDRWAQCRPLPHPTR
ncbi:hypothetical protein LWE61_16010 [Sphingobium sufflavum]|uniref:hypothetical protein n=1 Tax=Sphingobium sufflavum TaxID=1129547 RepID=UPI001F35C5F1|nr:hypothetical protein [Sphingobium sufflavum]MCE7798054.1 hypothetical protein [Sphingobium sufflavum]